VSNPTENPLVDAVRAGASGEELLNCPLPATFRGAHLRREDMDMFAATDEDPDVRRSLHVGHVPLPELAPDEVLLAVMASGINFNTVWSATFRPMPTFHFLRRLGRQNAFDARHDQPWHVIGSDAAGVVVRIGAGVRRWSVGDRVVVATAQVDSEDPMAHQDAMTADQRAWGFETNFGGLADFCVVKASQLLPKPEHLTWEEAAGNTLCAATAYRMLVSSRGAGMKQGDAVLIWGATGGLGGYAVQLVRNGGGIPIGVVSSPEKAAVLRRLGCEAVVQRDTLDIGPDGFATRSRGGSSATRSAGSPGRTRTSSSSTPARRRSARRCTWRVPAERSSPAGPAAGSSTPTTTGTCGCGSSGSSAATARTTRRPGRSTGCCNSG
jgi:crotonyl-CoA reductase